MHTLELSQIDTRYSSLRLKNPKQEQALLSSIIEKGILEPLYVIKENLLVDGNKRYRCANRLNIESVPVTLLDTGEVPGLIKFIKLSNNKGLSQIEQACLVDELYTQHNLGIPEIANRLERSVSWVRMRLGILHDMDEAVKERIMSGKFPFRNYMYSIRKHTRVHNAPKREITAFVESVSGQGLSTRDIDILCQGYFSGNEVLKAQINQGKLDWTLKLLKEEERRKSQPDENMTEYESKVLSQLNWAYLSATRLPVLLEGRGFKSPVFFQKAASISGKILKKMCFFDSSLREFYDRASKASGGDNITPAK